MPTYNVHVFAVVRVKLVNIQADDPREAITQARNSPRLGETLHQNFFSQGEEASQPPGTIVYVEPSDEISHYLVDEVGDDQYRNSRYYVDADHTYDNLMECARQPELVYPVTLEDRQLQAALREVDRTWGAVRQHLAR